MSSKHTSAKPFWATSSDRIAQNFTLYVHATWICDDHMLLGSDIAFALLRNSTAPKHWLRGRDVIQPQQLELLDEPTAGFQDTVWSESEKIQQRLGSRLYWQDCNLLISVVCKQPSATMALELPIHAVILKWPVLTNPLLSSKLVARTIRPRRICSTHIMNNLECTTMYHTATPKTKQGTREKEHLWSNLRQSAATCEPPSSWRTRTVAGLLWTAPQRHDPR